jgi:hypothetical protein
MATKQQAKQLKEQKEQAALAPADNSKMLVIKVLDDARWLERVRLLDKHCFPVKYSDKYYNALMPTGTKLHDLSHTAFFNGILVGSITCRLEAIWHNTTAWAHFGHIGTHFGLVENCHFWALWGCRTLEAVLHGAPPLPLGTPKQQNTARHASSHQSGTILPPGPILGTLGPILGWSKIDIFGPSGGVPLWRR